MTRFTVLLLVMMTAAPSFASKKDFRGLFGSYKRERFTENEARSSDFGADFGLSTLIPVSSVVKSTETRGGTGENLYYATFFDIEGSLLFSLWYHWQFYASIGYFSYDTRKQNTTFTSPTNPLFHEFEMKATPVILGVRYRFTVDDIVPYVGVGAGMSFVTRKSFYDVTNSTTNSLSESALTYQIQAGAEFYVTPRIGLRLEAAAFHINTTSFTWDIGGNPANNPILIYQPSIWSMRYSSSIFFLF